MLNAIFEEILLESPCFPFQSHLVVANPDCEEQGKDPECHLSLGIHQPLLWRTISLICYWEKRTLNDNSNALR